MYKIVKFNDQHGQTFYIVYDKIKHRELARYASYLEAFNDIKGR